MEEPAFLYFNQQAAEQFIFYLILIGSALGRPLWRAISTSFSRRGNPQIIIAEKLIHFIIAHRLPPIRIDDLNLTAQSSKLRSLNDRFLHGYSSTSQSIASSRVANVGSSRCEKLLKCS